MTSFGLNSCGDEDSVAVEFSGPEYRAFHSIYVDWQRLKHNDPDYQYKISLLEKRALKLIEVLGAFEFYGKILEEPDDKTAKAEN